MLSREQATNRLADDFLLVSENITRVTFKLTEIMEQVEFILPEYDIKQLGKLLSMLDAEQSRAYYEGRTLQADLREPRVFPLPPDNGQWDEGVAAETEEILADPDTMSAIAEGDPRMLRNHDYTNVMRQMDSNELRQFGCVSGQ